MSELVHAQSIKNPDSTIELELLGAEPLFAGGYEPKQLVTALRGSQSLSLVRRDYESRYVANWLAFDKAGMSVVPSVYAYQSNAGRASQNPGPDKLLLTDMKADGSELYGKGLLICLRESAPRD